MSPLQWVRDHYGVPAEIGRRVICYGKPGIITKDLNNYIGVTLDAERPGRSHPYHPTHEVVYGEMGVIRKASRSTARYQRYLEYGDMFQSFIQFCYWDSDPERSWNGGRS